MANIAQLSGVGSAAIGLQNGIIDWANRNPSTGAGAPELLNGVSGLVKEFTKPGSPLGVSMGVTAGYTSLFALGNAVSEWNEAQASGDSDAATRAGLGVASAIGGVLSNVPHPVVKGIGIGLNIGAEAAKAAWDNGWRPFGHPNHDPNVPAPDCGTPLPIGDRNRNGIPDIHETVDPRTAKAWEDARNWRPRIDPLTLDLDGDGIETLGVNADNRVLFDHDGDGAKHGTGWVSSDDAMLVLDRNNNGTIDNGRELFGDNTQLANGRFAADGFAALAELDINGGRAANDATYFLAA